MPSHSGRELDPDYERLIKAYGYKKLDLAWTALVHVDTVEYKGYVFGDIGPQFH